jgi:hypothetical protein
MHLEVRPWWLHGLLLRYFSTGFDYRRAESLRAELERLESHQVTAAKLRWSLAELYQAGLAGHLRVGTRTLRWRWAVGADGRRQLSERLATKLAEQAGHLEVDGRWYYVEDAIRTGARSAGHAVPLRALLKAKCNRASAVASGTVEQVPVVALEVEPDWIQAEPIPGPGFDPIVAGMQDALALEQEPAEPEPEPPAVGYSCRVVLSGIAPASTTSLPRDNQPSTRSAEPEVVETPPEEPEPSRSTAAEVASTEGGELARLLAGSKLLRTVRARRRVVERVARWCSERGRSPEELAQVLEALERHATGWKSPAAAVVTLTESPEDLDALWSEVERAALEAADRARRTAEWTEVRAAQYVADQLEERDPRRHDVQRQLGKLTREDARRVTLDQSPPWLQEILRDPNHRQALERCPHLRAVLPPQLEVVG